MTFWVKRIVHCGTYGLNTRGRIPFVCKSEASGPQGDIRPGETLSVHLFFPISNEATLLALPLGEATEHQPPLTHLPLIVGRLHLFQSAIYFPSASTSLPSTLIIMELRARVEMTSNVWRNQKRPQGDVYVWGWNYWSQLGIEEDKTDKEEPFLLSKLSAKKVVFVAAGQNFSTAISEKGLLYSWGLGNGGQLGHHDEENGSFPREVSALRKKPAAVVACGETHALILKKSGGLYSVGNGESGRLGLGNENNCNIPKRINIKKKVVGISCGDEHSAVFTEANTVLTWGNGAGGRLGTGDEITRTQPVLVESLAEHKIAQICCGSDWTAVLTITGKVFTFGVGSYGKLGHGNDSNQLTPKLVEGMESERIVAISCGADHMAAITADGDVYTWGCGGNGRLGHGSERDCKKPLLVKGMKGLTAVSVECGGYHMGVTTLDGELYMWGWNVYGQCGLGLHVENQLTPVLVEQLRGKKVIMVACGESHTIALVSSN